MTTNSGNALQVMAQQQLGQLPAAVRAAMAAAGNRPSSELAAGITSGFAILTLRGKVWRIKHRGEEKALVNEKGEPRYSIEVVMVKASENIAKIFYQDGYAEGSTAPPDCWSSNGRVPDPAAPATKPDYTKGPRTGPTCVGCWANAWGSSRAAGANGAGSKGKACADSKRVALLPLEDLDNTFFGGPMLMRIPPASLGDLKTFADKLDQMGFPYYAVATRISFDMQAEYPKLIFSAIRALTDEEAEKIMALRGNPEAGQPMDAQLERILNTALDAVETDGVDHTHPGLTFEQPPVPATPAAVQPDPVKTMPPATKAPVAPVQTPSQVVPAKQAVNGASVDAEVPAGYMPLPGGKFFHEASGQVVDKLPEPPKPEPVAVTPEVIADAPLPEGWVDVMPGRWYHPEHGMQLEDPRIKYGKPAEPAKDPNEGRIPLPDGNFYDAATGEIYLPNGQPKAGPATAAAAPIQQAAASGPTSPSGRVYGKPRDGLKKRNSQEVAEDEAYFASQGGAPVVEPRPIAATPAQTVIDAAANAQPLQFEQPLTQAGNADIEDAEFVEHKPDMGGGEAPEFDNMLDGLLA